MLSAPPVEADTHCSRHVTSASILTAGITLGTNRAGVWEAFLVRVREFHISALSPPLFLTGYFVVLSTGIYEYSSPNQATVTPFYIAADLLFSSHSLSY
jgi:hypothetical protein